MKDETLKALADNPSLTKAVRDVLEKYFSTDKLTSDLADIELGQMVRARLVGLKAINDAFAEIASYRTQKKPPAGDNPAY